MSQLFGFGQPVPQSALPPPSPARTDAPIQKASDAVAQNPARQGYASQFLTTADYNHQKSESKQRKLGGF